MPDVQVHRLAAANAKHLPVGHSLRESRVEADASLLDPRIMKPGDRSIRPVGASQRGPLQAGGVVKRAYAGRARLNRRNLGPGSPLASSSPLWTRSSTPHASAKA